MNIPLLILILQIILFVISALSFTLAVKKSKKDQFYSDTPLLLPLGIFVWGDALILGPFWMVSAILFSWLSPVMILRYFLTFFLFRSAYEVIYWINHQVAQKNYAPPLFRRIEWLKPNEAAILYQLLNMCQAVLCAVGLFWSWR